MRIIALILVLIYTKLPLIICLCYRKNNYIQKYDPDTGYYYLEICTVCDNITSSDQISENLFYKDNNQILNLEITNSYIPTLYSLFFSKFSTINKLCLNKTHIKTIEAGAFTGLTDLQELHLDNNELLELPDGILNSLQKLKILNLTNNHIVSIEKSALLGMANLRHLYLKNNTLSQIEDDLLKTQKRLEYLDLSQNPLDKTSLETLLTTLSNLTFLDLSSTHLSTLDFPYFPGVKELYMGHNQLENIQKKIFDNSKNISIVDFSFNKISTIDGDVFSRLKSLNRLLLENNHIIKLDHRLFRDLTNLTFLNLSNNRIDQFEFGTFENMKKLQILDISSNKLVDLHQYTFSSLSRLSNLYFDNNQISSFDVEDLTSHLKSLNLVSLNKNPWKCEELVKICHLFGSITIVEGNTYDVPNVRGIACSSQKNIAKLTNFANFNVNDFAKIFQKSIDGGVKNSKMERFFGEDFKNSKFFQYFDQDYEQSNFFKYLDNYKFATVEKGSLNDTKAEKLTSLQVTPHENNNILILITVVLVGIFCCLLFNIYLKFNLVKQSKYNCKPQLSSQMELC